jgi:hypothetical protein
MIDTVRWGIVVCACLSILLGTPQWRRWLREYPPEMLQGRLALAVLNVAAGYGTAESMARGIPGGPRTFVVAVGALWCLYAVAWQPAARSYHRLTRRTRALPRHPADTGRC